MIIQAISLLDELDKELNTYAMRVREWYGWHFPEMGKIVTDNIQYAKVVKKMGIRKNATSTDLSDILTEETEGPTKEAAEVSMGTEISETDITNIKELCDQVIDISEYRASLSDYLRNRMQAIAPNLTIMVGELVGARLIAHAGSLLNLAKHPASTVQILGAEKALFRALKTKRDTPKYGLIYHASLIGQANAKIKGKVSRMLAAKTSLAVRTDALGDATDASVGLENRARLERRVNALEGGAQSSISGSAKGKSNQQKYTPPVETKSFNEAADVAMGGDATEAPKKKKKDKKEAKAEEPVAAEAASEGDKPKKGKKRKAEEAAPEAAAEEAPANGEVEKKKKKKAKTEE
jgi:nucleolar protein 58